ncbi:MAG: sulfite exporter TauE/SafE family protein [Pseudomonadota bacterium]
MWELGLLLITGIATGFLNVMAGGGSMLSVPVMIFLGVPGTIANATNRIAILPQNIAAVLTFARDGFADYKLSLSLGLCTLPGALIGSYIATKIPNDQFNWLLALIMVAILIIMAIPDRQNEDVPINDTEVAPISRQRLLVGHLLMVVIGFWGGFIHIGVGFLLMPVLNKVLKLDLVTTNSHKVFIVFVYTSVALLVFSSQLELYWTYGLALAVGTVTGGILAAKLQISRGVGPIKLVLNLVIIAFIIKLLFF